MKLKFYFNLSAAAYRCMIILILVSGICSTVAWAQPGTPTYINNSVTSSSNAFPFNTTANIKIQWIYVPGAFTTLGGGSGTPTPGGMAISKIYIRFSATINASTVYPNFTISLGQNLGTQANWGTASITTYPFTTGLTTCFFQASGFQFTGITANSWYGITLQTPFVYDPSLSLIVEAKSTLTTAGGNSVATQAAVAGQMQRLYGPFAATTGTSNTLLTPFGFDLVSAGACTNPITAGTSTATPSTPVCTGSSVALNLSGNTGGTGQTYQWFSDPVLGGSYSTAVSGVLSSPAYSISPSSTLYYRCVEICSGGSPAISTPVQVQVSPGLSGTFTINSALATGGTNFQTFAAAISALSCGVSGPVVFNVVAGSGPYNEQAEFPQVAGTSAVNTITINGNNCTLSFSASVSTAPGTLILNGTDYLTVNNLNIAGLGATYALTVHLWNGANNNTFSGCTITSPVTASPATTQVPFSISGTGIIYSGTGTSGNNNVVTGCTITGGYYCVTMYSSTTAGLEALNNSVTNSTIRDAYSYNCYLLYQSGAIISGNDISRPTRTSSTTTAGAYISTGDIGCKVEKNRIHNMFDSFLSSTSTCYGVAILADGTAALPNRVENNLVYNMNGNGAMYGIYNSTGPYMYAYHNTIVLDDQATTTGAAYGLYQTGATTGIDYKNNIIYITRSGTGIKRCIYFVSTTTGNSSNNNDFYMNSTGGTNNNVGQYVSTNYLNLSDWQTANGGVYDGASQSSNPVFSNPGAGNFQPTSVVLDNSGTGVGVLTDILGTSRNAVSPDPGAYEFTLSAGLDIGAFALVTPSTSGCYSNVQSVVIKIKNYGGLADFTSTPVIVTCNVTGTTTATLSATVSSGTLASNNTMDVTLTGTFDMSINGSYTFNAFTFSASDGNSANDPMAAANRTRAAIVPGSISASQSSYCLTGTPLLTLAGNSGGNVQWQSSTVSASGPWTNVGTGASTYSPTVSQTTYFQVEVSCLATASQSNVVTIAVNNPQITGTTPGSHCGTGSVTLSATGTGATTNWYTAASGGTPVFTGPSYTTPVISSNTNYYVSSSSGGFTGHVGKVAIESTAGTGGGLTTYVVFDALSNFTLQTVDLFPFGSTNGASGTVTIELRSSTGTPIMNQVVNVTACNSPTTCTAQTVTLNFPITGGATYRLGVNAWTGGITNLYRDLTGVYPYTLPGVVSITGTSLAPYFYFFYNWAVSTGCESARTPVLATITTAPVISPSTTLSTVCNGGSTTLNVSSSNPGYTYVWTPGNLSGASVTVNPTATTTYTVTAVDNSSGAFDGCGQVATVPITAQPAVVTVTATPSGICGTSGTTVVTLTPASGYPNGTIQWQNSPNGSVYTNIGGATSASYSSPTISSTTYYRAVISDGNNNMCVQPSAAVVVGVPSITNSVPASRCGTGTLTLSATPSAGATVNWYTSSSGGVPVGTGNSFTTPMISSTTNYYAGAGSGTTAANVGYPSAIPLGTTGVGITNYGIVFDALTSFTLYSVDVFPIAAANNTTGNITIGLYSTNGTLLQSAVVSVVGNLIASVTAQTVTLNFNIAPGTNYKLAPAAITGSGITNLLFQPSASAPGGNWGYPFTVPGVVSILTSTLTAAPANTPRNDLYYYFYNWSVSAGCEGTRVLVPATITPSPDVDVTSTFAAVCSGGSTDIAASSVNDPDYTYTWTSSPAGFTATGPGPHLVSPGVTTKYYVLATDVSGNANNGCAAFDSITVVSGGILASGSVSSNLNEHCVSGTSNLTVTGASGGFIQWQKSTVSSSGPWNNVGTGATTLSTGVISQTSYYQVIVSCQTNSVTSNVQTITVNNPQLTSTTGNSRCGPGPVTLSASAVGGTINWYSASTGGSPLATGNSYSPNISGTTTFYAAAAMGGGGTSTLGLPNRVGATTNSGYSDVGLMFDAVLPFTLQSVAVYPVATTPSGNVTAVIALKNSAGTILQSQTISIPTAVSPGIKTVVGLNFSVPAGTGHRLVFTSASGGGLTGFIRELTTGFTYPYTLPGYASITSAYTAGASASYYYYFYDWQIVTGCEGVRVPVVANMTTAPSLSVTPTQTTCSNVSKVLSVTSPNDPSYTYIWTPGNLSGASVTVNPTTTTTYTVNAIDNTTGPNAGCANNATVLVNVNPAPAAPTMTPTSALLCEDDTVKLKASGQVAFNATIGTQTTTTQTGMPFRAGNATAFRTQYLYTASELTAAGLTAGNWNQFKWTVTTAIGAGATMGNLTIRVGNTTATALTSTFLASPATIVYGPTNYVASASLGDITFTFITPYSWNGTSNVLIEICHDNPAPTGVSGQVSANTTGFVSVAYVGNVCGTATGATTASIRPIIKILGTSGGPVSWSPLTDLFEDVNLTTPYTGGLRDSVYSHPSVTHTYTATTTLGSCIATSSVTVTVDVIPQVNIIAAGPTSYCPGSTVTLNASTHPTYTNYAWTPGGPSGAGATSFTVGGNTNSTVVYRVTATGAGGCTSHQDIPVTVYDTVSPDITVIGTTNLCTGQTTTDLQGDVNGPTGPAQSYLWSTTETSSLITVSTGGIYSLTTTDVHNCITHYSQVITESTAPPAPIVTPPGPFNLCSYDGGNTYGSITLTCTNYSNNLLWSTSEATQSIVVDYGDVFNVIYTDPAGCFSVSNTVITNTYLASDAATNATSNASFNAICLGNNVTLSVNGGFLGDGADWHWYEGSCTGTPRGTGPSITLTPATAGVHNYFVRAEGICNTTTCATISILVSTAPPTFGASITTWPVSGCNGTTAVMSGPAVVGASYYNWSCSQGGVLFNGSPGPLQTATPTVNVTFVTPPPAGASGYSVCVFAGNACGQSLAFCRFIRARVSQPGVVSGNIIACANTNSTYSIAAVAGADTYTWTITGNATINGGTNTITTASNSITANFLAGWSTGTLSVYASLNCGFNSASRTLAISSTPAVPGIMNGPGYVCPGNSATFSVPAVSGAASYNWTTSVPGAVITPAGASASILFPAVIPAGSTVCVTAVSSCGNASAQRCKGIANGIPNTPGVISGPVNGQCGQSGVSYSITPVAQATGYLWTASNGATVAGPNNLSAVSINFPTTFVTCTLSVVALNSCGTSVARTLIVNGAPSQPGTISGSQSVCNGAVEPYSTGGATGATSYGWTVPPGAIILNTPPYGASILVQWGATGGNVIVNAINDCGTSINRTLSVAVTCREAQVSNALESTATLYPNPTQGKTTLEFVAKADTRFSLQVMDVTGRVVMSEDISAVEGVNMHELDFTTIAKGVYMVRLESEGSDTHLLKVTVE